MNNQQYKTRILTKYYNRAIALICLLSLCNNATANSSSDFFKQLQTERVVSDPSVKWEQVGPGMSGNNMLVTTHSTDPNLVFVGPNMGNSYRSLDAGETWHTILDDDGKGFKAHEKGPIHIHAPEFSRQQPQFGFATTDKEAALWKTNDFGKSWTKVKHNWKKSRLGAIAVDPNNDKIWYVGTGMIYNVNMYGFSLDKQHGFERGSRGKDHKAAIWKSVDAGNTWHDITPKNKKETNYMPSDAQVSGIIIDPITPSTVYVATTYGLYKSLDKGLTWNRLIDKGLDHDIIRSLDMHINEKTNQITLFAVDLVKWKKSGKSVANDGGGIFRSIDGGESWENLNSNLSLDVATLSSDVFFKNNYYKRGVSKWFGIPYKQALKEFPVIPSSLLHSINKVVVDPNNPLRIFVFNDYKGKVQPTFLGGNIWRTEDGGKHWQVTLRNGSAWDTKHKAYWNERGNPTHHNVTFRAQKQWENEDSYFQKSGSAFTYNADGSLLIGQIAKAFIVSKDHGNTWNEVDELETKPGNEVWIGGGNNNMPGRGFIQDKRIPDTVYMATGENDFWVTHYNETPLRAGVQAAKRIRPTHEGEYSVSAVAIDPQDANTIYTLQSRQTHRGKILKSVDGGNSFKVHGTTIEHWPDNKSQEQVQQMNLKIDPVNSKNMYFNVPKSSLLLNFTGKGNGFHGMHKSTDGGKTWKIMNNGLPKPYDVANYVFDPKDSNTLYAALFGADGGLYKSTDGAKNWKAIQLPKGIESVVDIKFSSDEKLYISSGHSNSNIKEGGVFYTTTKNPKNPKKNDWKKIFNMPWTGNIAIAAYDPKVILITVMASKKIDYINPGTYLSKDGGETWSKINQGNSQSDRINDVAIHMTRPNVYYVSTYGSGSYISTYTP